MTAKLDPFAAAPALMKEWYRTSRAVAASLEPSLVHLVEIRATTIQRDPDCPASLRLEADGELQTTALEIEDGRITAIYVVRNPDKLKHLH